MAEEKKKKRTGWFRSHKKKKSEKVAVAEKALVKAKSKASEKPLTFPRVVNVNSESSNSSKALIADTNAVAKAKSKAGKKSDVKMKPSWLARRKFFVNMTDNAFDLVDADGSGEVDEKELYSGLLLIHLKLGCYAGPAACKPVDHERVLSVFHKMDVDGSGSLDRAEFREVMMILFSNVLLRVTAQWSLTLMVVPILAQYILDGISFIWLKLGEIISELDEYSPIFDAIELFIEDKRDTAIANMPESIMSVLTKGQEVLGMVPDSVWETVPLTLLAAVMGMLAVPFTLFKIDDFFQKAADKKKDEHEA